MSRRIIRHNDIYKPIKEQTTQKTDAEQQEDAYVNHDHPDVMGNVSATALYIAVMLIGTIFNDRLLIYLIASVIYFGFINRRSIRKKKWDKMQEEKKNGGHKE